MTCTRVLQVLAPSLQSLAPNRTEDDDAIVSMAMDVRDPDRHGLERDRTDHLRAALSGPGGRRAAALRQIGVTLR
jgi:hypothetical protein